MQQHIREHGLSIIELLVGLTIGLIIILGATMMVIPIAKTTSETATASKMNTDARTIIDLLTNELQRAGYGISNDPSALMVHGNNCIIYGYRETPTSPPLWNAFRYNAINKTIQVSYGLTSAPTDCNTGSWSALNDINTLAINTFNAECVNDDPSDSSKKMDVRLELSFEDKNNFRLTSFTNANNNDTRLLISPRNTHCHSIS